MEIYQIWAIACLVFLGLELLTPAMFFLNLAFGAVVSALCAYFGFNIATQIIIFVISSFICIYAIRPLFLKSKRVPLDKEDTEKYVGKTAKVIEEIGKNLTDGIGKIKIYDEVWRATSTNDEKIEVGSMVKIVKNESLLMFVEKIKEV